MKKRRTASVIFGVILLCLFILLAFHMRQTKVVCVGDSITYGSGAGKYRKTKSYPAILQEKLGRRYRVRNYGLRGRTLLDYGNFPYKEEPEYKETLKEKADIYISLCLGRMILKFETGIQRIIKNNFALLWSLIKGSMTRRRFILCSRQGVFLMKKQEL